MFEEMRFKMLMKRMELEAEGEARRLKAKKSREARRLEAEKMKQVNLRWRR